jgi:hypothetical protein
MEDKKMNDTMNDAMRCLFGPFIVFGGFVALHYFGTDANYETTKYSKITQEGISKEGLIDVRDVNGDGLEDLIFEYKDLNGQVSRIVFYKTDKGYLTSEQIKIRACDDAAKKYFEKISVENGG